MENELQRKIEWLEKRHAAVAEDVENIENDRRLDRSSRAQVLLRHAKKEKLRLKDHIQWMKNLESRLQKKMKKDQDLLEYTKGTRMDDAYYYFVQDSEE